MIQHSFTNQAQKPFLKAWFYHRGDFFFSAAEFYFTCGECVQQEYIEEWTVVGSVHTENQTPSLGGSGRSQWCRWLLVLAQHNAANQVGFEPAVFW